MNGNQEDSLGKPAQPNAKPTGFPDPPILKLQLPHPSKKNAPPTPKPALYIGNQPVQGNVDSERETNTGNESLEQTSNQDAIAAGNESLEKDGNQDANAEQNPSTAEVTDDTNDVFAIDPAPNPDSDQTKADHSQEKVNTRRPRVDLEEAQKNSSGNAITHGIMSMRLLRGEPREEFYKLYRELSAKYPPKGPLEKLCLERILMYHYRLRRLWRIEAEMMEHLMNQEQEQKTPKKVSLGASVQREFNQAVSFESLQRYEAAIERQLRRAIGELLVLQKIIPSIEKEPAHVAAFLRQLG